MNDTCSIIHLSFQRIWTSVAAELAFELTNRLSQWRIKGVGLLWEVSHSISGIIAEGLGVREGERLESADS